MDAKKLGQLADYTVIAVFACFVGIGFISIVTGSAWQILSSETFQFYSNIMTFVIMIVSGTVFSNSLIYYSQVRNVRRLVILLLAGNVIFLSLLYILTHPASIQWSSLFADRIRNRTITTTAGLAAMPGALLCSFAHDSPTSNKTQIAYGIWGGVIIPLFGILCLFSQEPLFVLTTLEGGLGGLTIMGWIVAITMPLIAAVSLVRFMLEYKRTKNRVALSFGFALILWIIASVFLSYLWDPLQIAELMYLTNIMAGMTVIGLALLMDAIIQPFKMLEGRIQKRTEELDKSKKESELFLMAWSHKVGNILQGITTFLDVCTDSNEISPKLSDGQSAASELSWEGSVINRQVTWLTEVKLSKEQPLVAVDLEEAITRAIKAIDELKKYTSIEFVWTGYPIHVLADDCLDLLFTGLFSHILLDHHHIMTEILITDRKEGNRVLVTISSNKESFNPNIAAFLKSRILPDLVNMDLDLYMSRLLLERYGADVTWNDSNRNQLVLEFLTAIK